MNFFNNGDRSQTNIFSRLLLLTVFASLSACDQSSSVSSPLKNQLEVGNINAQRLLNVDNEPGAWLTGGRDYKQSYYSPLETINKTNVDQ